MREAPLILVALVLGFAWPGQAAQNAAGPRPMPVEEWVGECRLAAGAVPLSIRIEGRSAEATGSADLPAHGGRTALEDVSRTGERMAFRLPGLGLSFRLTRRQDGSRADGTCARADPAGTATLVRVQSAAQPVDEYAGSFRLSDGRIVDLGPFDEMGGRLVFLEHGGLEERPLFGLEPDHFVAGPSLGVPYPFVFDIRFVRNARGAVSGLAWQQGEAPALTGTRIAPHQRVDVDVRNDGVALRGTLLLPEGPGPHPAVVFAHGSGPATRNVGFWNMFFVRLGMAVLSLDKRGAGASTGNWNTASLDDLASDWQAGVAALKSRPDIDPGRIGVHASSQGGWTAAIMASRSADVAFLIVRAGSGVSVADTMAHEQRQLLARRGLSGADVDQAVDLYRRVLAMTAAGVPYPAIRADIDATGGASWRQVLWTSPPSAESPGLAWVRLNGTYDATVPLASVRCPVLWFLAEQDANVPSLASAPRLMAAFEKSGSADATLKLLSPADHGFLLPEESGPGDWWAGRRLAGGYFSTMAAWLEHRGFAGAARRGETPPVALERGEARLRGPAGGAAHTYTMDLAAGDDVDIVIDQLGLDVAAVVAGPDGRKVMEANNRVGPAGREYVRFQAVSTGTYRIDCALGAAAPGGRYRLAVRNHLTAAESRNRQAPFDRQALQRHYWNVELAPGHLVSIGPADDFLAEGRLMYVDTTTRRFGKIFPREDGAFFATPTMDDALTEDVTIRLTKDARGVVEGLTWQERGRDAVQARLVFRSRVEEVSFANGRVTLSGILIVPEGPGPHPAVVFVHGSGPMTRNQSFFYSFFQRYGVAVLAFDKRGAGRSSGNWRTSSFDDLASDILAGVQYLKGRPDIDARRIGLHGISQGGWVGSLAAARSEDVTFLIVNTGSGVSVADNMAHEMAGTLRSAGLEESRIVEAREWYRTLLHLAGDGAGWERIRGWIAEGKDKPWFSRIPLARLPEDNITWGWLRLNGRYDSADALARVRCPVLWIFGDRDSNVPSAASEPRIREALARAGNRDVTLRTLAPAGHVLFESETGLLDDSFRYATTFAPGYWDLLGTWIEQHVVGDRVRSLGKH